MIDQNLYLVWKLTPRWQHLSFWVFLFCHLCSEEEGPENKSGPTSSFLIGREQWGNRRMSQNNNVIKCLETQIRKKQQQQHFRSQRERLRRENNISSLVQDVISGGQGFENGKNSLILTASCELYFCLNHNSLAQEAKSNGVGPWTISLEDMQSSKFTRPWAAQKFSRGKTQKKTSLASAGIRTQVLLIWSRMPFSDRLKFPLSGKANITKAL